MMECRHGMRYNSTPPNFTSRLVLKHKHTYVAASVRGKISARVKITLQKRPLKIASIYINTRKYTFEIILHEQHQGQ